jgi:hypothetical protein
MFCARFSPGLGCPIVIVPDSIQNGDSTGGDKIFFMKKVHAKKNYADQLYIDMKQSGKE